MTTIEASTVSATNIFIRKGIYLLFKGKSPYVAGHNFVGIVDELADGATNVRVGDRVYFDKCQRE